MKILVVGAGALGSVFGCLLKDKGHEVGLLEPTSRLDDIRNLGLTVSGLFGEHSCSDFALYRDADEVPKDHYDLALMTVKSFSTSEATRQIGPKLGPDALVVSLQNGLGNFEAVRDWVGEARTLSGRVIFGAQMIEKAHAKVTVYAEPVMIGSPTNSVDTARIGEIAEAFSDAGIPTEPTDEINKYIWAKLLYNCALNPLSAILNVPYGRLLEAEGTRHLMMQVVEEIFALAAAYHIRLLWDGPRDYISILFRKLIPDTAGHFASMTQDLQNGRRTEIDALNGAVVAMGAKTGLPCPVNSALTDLVRAAEKSKAANP